VHAENLICAILHYSALEHGLAFEGRVVVEHSPKIRALLQTSASFDASVGADVSAGIELVCKHLARLAVAPRASMTIDTGTPLSATRRMITHP
jgi:hypothetical protein